MNRRDRCWECVVADVWLGMLVLDGPVVAAGMPQKRSE